MKPIWRDWMYIVGLKFAFLPKKFLYYSKHPKIRTSFLKSDKKVISFKCLSSYSKGYLNGIFLRRGSQSLRFLITGVGREEKRQICYFLKFKFNKQWYIKTFDFVIVVTINKIVLQSFAYLEWKCLEIITTSYFLLIKISPLPMFMAHFL